MMASAAKACRSLIIELFFVGDRQNGRANLAKLISSSPYLHTLEISFFCELPAYDPIWMMMLSELFEAGVHWPNLKRLKLGAMKTTDISLMEFTDDSCHKFTISGACQYPPQRLSTR